MRSILSSALFVWAGLLLGVSFVATPAKFLAPSLPLAQALDVGRWTFHVLAWIEWPLAAVALIATLAAREGLGPRWKTVAACLAGIAAVLALETFWLRPVLDARVLAIMAGRPVPASRLHDLYIGLEAVKLMLILAGGLSAGGSPATPSSRSAV